MMKIKLAILEKDERYLNKIVSVFNAKYADKLEIYSFTDSALAIEAVEESRIDVFLANEGFHIDGGSVPKRCGFAYLVDSNEIEALNKQRTICKFQKADLIYRQILSIYSENAGNVTGIRMVDDNCKVITFSSPSGGAGSSTMAAACALHFSLQRKKTLYINLEPFGTSDVFFSADGQFTMSDVVFALKNKKTNLSMKLESCVRQDPRGVYFYSSAQLALDMLELNMDDIMRLISEVKLSGMYDIVVLDIPFEIEKAHLDVYNQSNFWVITGDGSEISNSKIFRAYNAVAITEQAMDIAVTRKMLLIYNKFSNKTGKSVEGTDLKRIGGAPRYEHATVQQVITELSSLDMFDAMDSGW